MMRYGLSERLRLSHHEKGLHSGRHPRNLAVACQKLYGSNKKWKKRYGYHKRSLSVTAMYRVKPLLGGKLNLRNYNAQVVIKALNKLTGLGMPETQYVV
ncbi:hypothetical protein VIRA109638_15235 [Vibrio rarus]